MQYFPFKRYLIAFWDRISSYKSVEQEGSNAERADKQARICEPTDALPEFVQRGWHAEEREHHRMERFYWRLSAILTGLAAAGAIVTVILSMNSLKEAKRAVVEAHNQSIEANRQANAAEKQIEYSNDAVRRQLRAYVGLERKEHIINLVFPECDINITKSISREVNRNEFKMLLKNFGLTPAYHVRACLGFLAVPAGADLPRAITSAKFKYCQTLGPNIGVMPTIWPNEDRTYSLPLSGGDVKEITNIDSGAKAAFIYGRIEYDDIFKLRRSSNFCYQMVIIRKDVLYAGCGNDEIWDDE